MFCTHHLWVQQTDQRLVWRDCCTQAYYWMHYSSIAKKSESGFAMTMDGWTDGWVDVYFSLQHDFATLCCVPQAKWIKQNAATWSPASSYCVSCVVWCDSGSVSSLQTPTWSRQRQEQPGQQLSSAVQTPQLQSPQLWPGATGEKGASCHLVPQPIPLFNCSPPPKSLSLSLYSQIAEYKKTRQDPPSDLLQQHKEVVHRLQWQKAQLERGPPALLSGSDNSYNNTGKLLYFLNNFNKIIYRVALFILPWGHLDNYSSTIV